MGCVPIFEMNKEKRFAIINHTADMGIIARGKDLPELFSNAAYGMFSLIADLEKVCGDIRINLEVKASSLEELLKNWLSELLYRYESEEILFRHFAPKIKVPQEKADTYYQISACVRGEKIDLRRHFLKREIKAVTYHQLEIKREKEWRARVIFDL